jgi:DNA invertase Pin-like site-specific DNA recombinase
MQNSIKKTPETAGTKKTVGYLRVSTFSQELEKNKADILRLANEKDLGRVTFVEEIASGKVSWKQRKIAEILDNLHKGDTIIVSELSRLGRSMMEVMVVLQTALERGIFVFAVKGNWALDNSIQSKVVAMAFSMAAEIERELISSRTVEALRHCKTQGIKLGRPRGAGKSKLDRFRPEIEAMLGNGTSQKFIATRYGATEGTVCNWIKKNKINRKDLKSQQLQAF